MQTTWNILLMFLSVLVAIIGSFTALTHAERMRATTGRAATLWMIAGSLTLGMTVWSMHFIGMLAWQLPIPIPYDLALTMLSAVPAIAAALLGFYVLRKTVIRTRRIVVSGLLMGAGISAMHYTGMAALKMTPTISYDPLILALSVAIATISAWGALLMMYRGDRIKLPPLPRFMLGAVSMGVAISGMHYVAMSGLHIHPGSTGIASAGHIDPGVLAALIVIVVLFWFVSGILASWFDQHLSGQNALALARLEREHIELRERAAKHAAKITQSLRESEEQLRMTLRCAPDAVLICEDDGRIVFVNYNFIDVVKYDRGSLYAMSIYDLVSADWRDHYRQEFAKILATSQRHVCEIHLLGKGGGKTPLELNAVLLPNGRIYCSCRDISERKLAEHKIHQLAFYDALTGLPNRRLLLDRLHQALAASARNGLLGAVLFLDMDHFKVINDTRGHDIGDLLLIEVAKRLQSCLRDSDTVARQGGDEFVIVLMLDADTDEAAAQAEFTADKIRRSLNQPYQLEGHTHHTTPSIGIVLFQGQVESVDDLLKYADAAMYQAKEAGRNLTRFYDPDMQAATEARGDLGEELHLALEKRQFRLEYQVQVDHSGNPVGAEALLRWEHPERGSIFPEQFISLAEESGLIVPIGLWVLQTACAQLKSWQHNPLTRELILAVNVSAKQFHQNDFIPQVQRVLQESGASPARLKLELTETVALENVMAVILKMNGLKSLGLSFAIDDFGTGHSSLQYLKRLPLDQIKIDQSFVRDITTDPDDAVIVQTIIAMTHALGMEVIAEGVETLAQREFLARHGCHTFQGFLFGKPMPIEQFDAWLDSAKVGGAGESAMT